MTLVKVFLDGAKDPVDVVEKNAPEVRKLLACGTLCSDGSVVVRDGREELIGDPTETSIVSAARKDGMPKEDLNRTAPRVAELPFDSDRKLMTTIHQVDGKLVAITKGAFDVSV